MMTFGLWPRAHSGFIRFSIAREVDLDYSHVSPGVPSSFSSRLVLHGWDRPHALPPNRNHWLYPVCITLARYERSLYTTVDCDGWITILPVDKAPVSMMNPKPPPSY
jgi:hypothetical protein